MFWRRRTTPAETTPPPATNAGKGGYLGHYGLTDWWRTTFNEEERSFLESYLAPLLTGNATWYTGTPPSGGLAEHRQDAARFLSTIAGFLKRSDRAPMAVKLLNKARELGTNPLNEHFLLMTYIEVRYKQRDSDPRAIPDVIEGCERGIAIGPQVIAQTESEHRATEARRAEWAKQLGEPYVPDPDPIIAASPFYKRLAIILRKQGRKDEAAAIEARYEKEWLPYTIDYKRAKAKR